MALTLAAPLLVRLYAGSTTPARSAGHDLRRHLPAAVFFYGLYTILGQVLNANGRFAGYMWAPALANIVAVGGLLWFLRAGYPTGPPPTGPPR